jgi:hypothetical protein
VILLDLKPETYCVSRMKDLRPFYTPRGYNSCFKRPLRFIAKREQSMWHSTRVSHYTCNPSQKKHYTCNSAKSVFSGRRCNFPPAGVALDQIKFYSGFRSILSIFTKPVRSVFFIRIDFVNHPFWHCRWGGRSPT